MFNLSNHRVCCRSGTSWSLETYLQLTGRHRIRRHADIFKRDPGGTGRECLVMNERKAYQDDRWGRKQAHPPLKLSSHGRINGKVFLPWKASVLTVALWEVCTVILVYNGQWRHVLFADAGIYSSGSS